MKRMGTCSFRRIARTSASAIRRIAAVAGLFGAMLLAGGCPPKQQQPATQPVAELPTGTELTASAGDATQRAREFELLASRIQQADISRQRPIVREVFIVLADVLPKLAGPRPSGVFVHQFSVVAQMRDQIMSQPPARVDAPVDQGTVNTGFAASYNALRDLGYTQFYQDEQLNSLLDELAKRVAACYQAAGREHAFAIRDA